MADNFVLHWDHFVYCFLVFFCCFDMYLVRVCRIGSDLMAIVCQSYLLEKVLLFREMILLAHNAYPGNSNSLVVLEQVVFLICFDSLC